MNFRIYLILLVILTLAACGAPAAPSISKATPTATPVTPTPSPTATPMPSTPTATSAPTRSKKIFSDLVVGYARIGAESEWRTANIASIKETAEQLGVTLMFSDDGMRPEIDQINAIRSFIAEGVDVIGISPIVPTGWDDVFGEAKTAGIPIIMVDRRADVPDDLYATYLAFDFVEQGRKAGRVMAELTGGQANMVELAGIEGSSAAIERGQGFREVLSGYPGLKILASQDASFTRVGGKEVMAGFLQQYGDKIEAVYAQNDDMALGAIEAIEAYGLQPGVDIKIVSIDAVRGAFEAMMEGKLNATIECNPLVGPQFFELALKVANREPVPKRVYVEEGIFYPEDAEELLPTRRY